MSITQQLAHWLIALGLEPAMAALLAIMALPAGFILVGAGVAGLMELRDRRRKRGPVFTGLR